MTTQMPLLGNSTATGYQPATGQGYDRGTAISIGAYGQRQGPASPAAPPLAAKPAPAAAGTTPGSAASVAAPDTSALGQDPQYLAYLRALGIQDTTQSANIQGQIDALNRNVALRLPQMQQDAARQNQLLSGRMEARGILNSGEAALNQAYQTMGQQRQQAALQDTAAQRTASLLNTLAQARANRGVNIAEKGLTAGQQVANNTGTQQINDQTAAIGTALGI